MNYHLNMSVTLSSLRLPFGNQNLHLDERNMNILHATTTPNLLTRLMHMPGNPTVLTPRLATYTYPPSAQSHTRFRNSARYAALFASVQDVAEAQLAADVLRSDESSTWSLPSRLEKRQLHEVIHTALEELVE